MLLSTGTHNLSMADIERSKIHHTWTLSTPVSLRTYVVVWRECRAAAYGRVLVHGFTAVPVRDHDAAGRGGRSRQTASE